MPIQTPLVGEQLERAQQVLKKCAKLGDGSSLFTSEKLIELGFSHVEGSSIPVAVGDEEGTSLKSDMSFRVPSFVKKSTPYRDQLVEEKEVPAPLNVTPISSVKAPSASMEKSSSTSRRRFSQQSHEAPEASGSRSHKRIKRSVDEKPRDSTVTPLTEAFLEAVKGKISEEAVSVWSKVKMAEVADMMTLSHAQNLYHSFNLSREITRATQAEMRARGDILKLEMENRTLKDEKKKLVEANKKFSANEAGMLKERNRLTAEREKLNTAIINLDKEKEELKVASAREREELQLRAVALQKMVEEGKAALEGSHEEKFNAGYALGIKDYMASTHEAFPNLDWGMLGPDAVEAIERIKKEKAAAAVEAEKTTVEAPQAKAVEELPEVTPPTSEDVARPVVQIAETEPKGSDVETQVEAPSTEQGTAETPSGAEVLEAPTPKSSQ